jgi:hypothetical protein
MLGRTPIIDRFPMLSRFDDYPIHQTAEPIALTASSDRCTYDLY